MVTLMQKLRLNTSLRLKCDILPNYFEHFLVFTVQEGKMLQEEESPRVRSFYDKLSLFLQGQVAALILTGIQIASQELTEK